MGKQIGFQRICLLQWRQERSSGEHDTDLDFSCSEFQVDPLRVLEKKRCKTM